MELKLQFSERQMEILEAMATKLDMTVEEWLKYNAYREMEYFIDTMNDIDFELDDSCCCGSDCCCENCECECEDGCDCDECGNDCTCEGECNCSCMCDCEDKDCACKTDKTPEQNSAQEDTNEPQEEILA